MHIAVLGGGLTGLSAAYHLSRRFPNALITLIEKENRLGGWVRSERVELSEGSSILLEAGPRTLRPNSKAVMELINFLNLSSDVLTTPTTSPAARARFLHSPPHQGLLQIPVTPLQMLTSPLASILAPAVLSEPFRDDYSNRRPEGLQDESVDSFLTRRFGPELARTFGSALVHGVYAADSRQLSVRAAFPSLWDAETRGEGSLLRGFWKGSKVTKEANEEYALGDVPRILKGASVFSFQEGISTITKALEKSLEGNRNVLLLKGTGVTSLGLNPDNRGIKVNTTSQVLHQPPTHVVSTLPLPILHTLTTTAPPIPHLLTNPQTSVSVLSLIFPSPQHTLHPSGFGYLIPRPPTGYPKTRETPGILGTVFDSCSTSAQDPNAGHLTKMTVMFGGPYPSSSSLPSSSLIPEVLKSLEEHLKTRLPEPVYAKVHHHKECIPTLKVGHLERMEEMKKVLREREGWGGRLEVVGAGVGGVSVGDCVEAGRGVGLGWT